MTVKKKSCVNCAYLAKADGETINPTTYSINPLPDGRRGKLQLHRNNMLCFLGNWKTPYIQHREMVKTNHDLGRFPEIEHFAIITDDTGAFINLARHKCQDFYPSAKRRARTMDKCHADRVQKRNNRRFFMTTVIGITVLVFSIMTWLKTGIFAF